MQASEPSQTPTLEAVTGCFAALRHSESPVPQSVIAFALLIACSGALHGAPVRTEHVEAELVAARTAIEPGKPLLVALRPKIIPHWHTYWRNPGDSGQPTAIQWQLPADYARLWISVLHSKFALRQGFPYNGHGNEPKQLIKSIKKQQLLM